MFETNNVKCLAFVNVNNYCAEHFAHTVWSGGTDGQVNSFILSSPRLRYSFPRRFKFFVCLVNKIANSRTTYTVTGMT